MNNSQERSSSELGSPCIKLCRMDDNDLYCLGCYRTLDEIAAWGNLSNLDKQIVLLEIQERRKDKLS
ncbi:DUF1289 domain-containing protein [Polynucleobacter sp. 30F-ANTBAC]|uniref:DUF1289 domain-containing protein n=1 Tax=Polynucleobacter sp. 30F-ANTBAC TaxID=2689095 RepID=UPI00351CD430